MTVTSETAIELILAKREADKNRQIKVFEQDAEMKLLNGRYGPYISYKKKNYKIPAKTEPAELSYEACLEIVNSEVKEPKKTVRKKKQA
jgi:DNA topoisomerase-1